MDYQQALAVRSRPWAPWHVIPADGKPFMRDAVADLIRRTLVAMDPQCPALSEEDAARIGGWRATLEARGR